MHIKTCARFSSRLYSYIVIICDDLLLLLLRHVWGGGGGGWVASSIQWHPYIYNVYIVCSTIVVFHSSCRLASTYIISKHIKLLFLKTSNYALQSQILFSTYLKVHVYHIMELFIYAFKFQFIVNI